MSRILFVATMVLTTACGVAGAHTVAYVGGTDLVLVCNATITTDWTETHTPGIGGACFAPGHVTSSVTVVDSVLNPVGATVCQPLFPVWKPVYTYAECRNPTAYCGVGVVEFMDPNRPVLVFIDGPIFGNPILSACGITMSMGAAGSISHD